MKSRIIKLLNVTPNIIKNKSGKEYIAAYLLVQEKDMIDKEAISNHPCSH